MNAASDVAHQFLASVPAAKQAAIHPDDLLAGVVGLPQSPSAA